MNPPSTNSSPAPADPNAESFLPQAVIFGPYCTIMRKLRPDDADRLVEFFHSHTEETVRSRYGYLLAQMSPERAAELTGVDQSKDAALGVFEMEGDSPKLIAIGRYCAGSNRDAAELAFVVHEAYRNLGIATKLLEALAAIARERCLHTLTAQVHGDNGPMLAVFHKAGAVLSDIPGSDAESVTLPVTDLLLERLHACRPKRAPAARECKLPTLPRWTM
ncbi:MAG TPA: GNAT family N-acetyltransferase [Opitutaceae bacterium]|nr:GNAT family N-acetyltransferase [Opitutaceae bacterium]